MAYTTVSNVIVPEVFGPYTQQVTETKTRLIQSGAIVRDPFLDTFLAGGGSVVDVPSWVDLNAADNVSSDNAASFATPANVSAGVEKAVRMSRNVVLGTTALVSALAGSDPMLMIANRVGALKTRKIQDAFIATAKGVFANNAANEADLTVDVSGLGAAGAYEAVVTDINGPAFIDATVTMGDSADNLTIVVMHSLVKAKLQKLNLIAYIPDARGEITIPTYLGREVVTDDSLPYNTSTHVAETWLFSAGAFRMGLHLPANATELHREPLAADGGGAEALINRWEMIIHPVGYKFVGSPASKGGPTNASSSNNLANANSWERVYGERKQIGIARLITKEA